MRYALPSFLGASEYRPTAADIAPVPTPGKFYQVTRGNEIWSIAKRAYGSPRPGLFWINDAAWNSYIRKGKRGWEAYKVKGLQLTKHYNPDTAPSPYGSGKRFPLVWIPAAAGDEPKAAAPEPPAVKPAECPPCEPKIVEVQVPGPERIVEKVVEVQVPGPERIVEKVVEVQVPGPERVVEVPGPPRIVEKRVEVPVPGPERVVEVPGPPRIVEKRVEVPVPGPERIVEVPGPPRIVEKRVEVPVPGPERIVEVPGGARKRWTTPQAVGFWGILISGLANMGDK